jgi:hypothetical protein
MTQKSKTDMELIHTERERQIAEEGYTPAHDWSTANAAKVSGTKNGSETRR